MMSSTCNDFQVFRAVFKSISFLVPYLLPSLQQGICSVPLATSKQLLKLNGAWQLWDILGQGGGKDPSACFMSHSIQASVPLQGRVRLDDSQDFMKGFSSCFLQLPHSKGLRYDEFHWGCAWRQIQQALCQSQNDRALYSVASFSLFSLPGNSSRLYAKKASVCPNFSDICGQVWMPI